MALNIVFAGTPEFAARHLQALIDSPHNLLAVYTQPDRPAGRKRQLQASPVKQLAMAHNLPVRQPLNLKGEEAVEALAELKADLMVVVAYGLLLPQAILDTPRLGCVNVHASILPRWRGAAPIERAIEAGDPETGVTIMQMDAGLDTGPALLTKTCAIDSEDNAETVINKLLALGGPALLEAIAQLEGACAQPQQQNGDAATYAKKITKEELEIDWTQAAQTLDHSIRAFNPWRKPWSSLGDERIVVTQAKAVAHAQVSPVGSIIKADDEGILVACNEDALLLTRLQLPGKKAMSAREILNGYGERFAPGNCLGHPSE